MIDPKLLRDDFDGVITKLKTRGAPEGLSNWKSLDQKRRELLGRVEALRAEKNKLGPDIAKAKKTGTDVTALLERLRKSGDEEKEIEAAVNEVESGLLEIELLIPNLPDESIPIGTSDSDNRLEKEWGKKREFRFTPKPHWDVGEGLKILDFERGGKLSGSRFTVYFGDGARLERALINFMLDSHAKKHYTEILPPFLVRAETMQGSGQLPKFEKDLFKTGEFDPKLYLIPTAEVPLVNLHVDEILDASVLPLRYTAFTPCFRAEAGSHGRDVRGLIRQHQFNKVELVKLTTQETSQAEHEALTRDAESILEALGLPYQRKTLCSGDMGMAAAKTYDLEVWLPGLGEYREISSCSNTTDFQSRRTQTRYRVAAGEKPRFVHMLNGSGLAVGRTLLAILENYQQEDGTVQIPEPLRPYMNGQELIK